MSPISVLPGRIRFESLRLVGKEKECRHLAGGLRAAEGVSEVSVNRRTGRILVTFDESVTARHRVVSHIQDLIEVRPEDMPVLPQASDIENKVASAGSVVRHVLLDVAAHVFLSKPLNILLPVAMNTLLR